MVWCGVFTLEITWYDNFFSHYNCIFKVYGRDTHLGEFDLLNYFSCNALLCSSEGLGMIIRWTH